MPAKTVALLRRDPRLPARLQEIRRGQEGVVPKRGGDEVQVGRAIGSFQRVDLVDEIGEVALICARTECPDDG